MNYSRIKRIIKRLLTFTRRLFFLTKKEKTLISWNKANEKKQLRYSYPLNNKSVVFDLGGYDGQWASDIYSRYNCKIYIFEIVKKHYKEIQNRFKKNNNIKAFNVGISNKNKTRKVYIDDTSSSTLKRKGNYENITLAEAAKFFKKHKINKIDLLKINIEGGEYNLLEHLIQTNFIKKITDIQVQFHDFVPNAKARMQTIQKDLAKTHRLTYQYPFIWENWHKKN